MTKISLSVKVYFFTKIASLVQVFVPSEFIVFTADVFMLHISVFLMSSVYQYELCFFVSDSW